NQPAAGDHDHVGRRNRTDNPDRPLSGGPITASVWPPLGPASDRRGLGFRIGPGLAFGQGKNPTWGRVSSTAAVDLNTADAGGAAGGDWRTSDGGISRLPLSEDQQSLAMGVIAVDRTNANATHAD